jgi:hypothetical protein
MKLDLPRYLYRALNPTEIAAGNVLIPKARNLYQAKPILPLELPLDLVENPRNARQRHQYDSHRYPTSYVSTTPLLERAKHYALYSDPTAGIVVATRIIAKIDTATFDAFGIIARPTVAEFALFQISKPEDREILLEYRDGHEFPTGIIAGFINLEFPRHPQSACD